MTLEVLNTFREPLLFQGRYLFCVGGRGSGKTFFAVQKTIMRCLTESRTNHLVVRKTNTALRKSIWKSFHAFLRKSDLQYRVKWMDQTIIINGNEIIFMGLDDPDKIKSIEGINGSVVMEECLELSRQDFDALDAILRGPVGTYAQMIGMLNPDRKTSFVYTDFVERETPGAMVHTSTVADNVYMPEGYTKVLQSIQDPEKRKSWLFGQWASFGGLILKNLAIRDFDIQSVLQKGTVIAGVDWGYNDPSVFLLISIYDNEIYIIDEIYIRQTDTDVFCGMARELVAGYGIPEGRVVVYPENAETDRNVLLERLTDFDVRKIRKDKAGELSTLREHRVYIHTQCTETIKEAQSWQYACNKDGQQLDVPRAGCDHTMDALCYAVHNHFVGSTVLEFLPV